MREEAGSGHERPVAPAIAAPQQLVAAADGEQRDAARVRRPQGLAFRREVGSDETLLTVLAASDVEEVVRGGIEPVSEADGCTSSSWPRSAARRASTAMFPRSA